MCESKPPKCDSCRTINLAKHVKQPKPNMQMYDKCKPTERVDCFRPMAPEVPIRPTCIKVCSKEEYLKRGFRPKMPKPSYGHGNVLYAVKAGILVGAVYFTYAQGVWGDQNDVIECINRWQEYMRSLNTRVPPTFNECGKVVRKETGGSDGSLLAPIYSMYKEVVTTCFSGLVKLPTIMKCAYIDYIDALQRKKAAEEEKRKMKK